MSDNPCLFCRISNGQLPADVVWQTDDLLAFKDIHPKAPVHILIIPKKHVATVEDLDDPELAGKLMLAIGEVARQVGVAKDGFRTIINTRNHGGQDVDHLHIHILGGEPIGPMRT